MQGLAEWVGTENEKTHIPFETDREGFLILSFFPLL